MATFPRYFTPAEANDLLPRIRKMMGEVLSARDRILEVREDLIPVLRKAQMNGGNQRASQAVREFEKIERGIARIQAMGAQVKDLNRGLVDFPALREGQEVFLCWQYGEEKVEWWHDLESGFPARQRL